MKKGLSIDLLTLVLREIPFPSILVLRKVCRKWDNTINDKTRFQGSYTRYRFEEIETRVLLGNLTTDVWIKWLNLSLDQGLDPSVNGNIVITWAAGIGHLATVERLLKDPRVDPSANNNSAIQWSMKPGHLATVERLLRDPRVKSTLDLIILIKIAETYNHPQLVRLLYTFKLK